MSQIKILIVDDSSTIRKSAELFLTKAGYEVFSAEDGLELLTVIDSVSPDLVFVDVVMPKIDGLQACQIIRRNPAFTNIPIIFLSSKDSPFDVARGLMVGGTDYLTKPFSKTDIVGIVQKYTANLAEG